MYQDEIISRIFSAVFLSMCTGSILFAFWSILRRVAYSQLSPRVYDALLKVILVFFYIPAGYLLIHKYWENGIVFYPTQKMNYVIYAVSIVWIIGSMIALLKLIRKAFQLRREKSACFPCKRKAQQVFEQCKKDLNIQKQIELLQGYQIETPMIAGIRKPCVFLPIEDYTEEQLRICMYHELTHYKKHDIFWNYISCITMCIYWCFPWIKLIFHRINEWSEITCDLYSMDYIGPMKQYFTNILDMNYRDQNRKVYVAACLFENNEDLEYRMQYAMIYKRQKKLKYSVMYALVVIFCGVGVSSVYASSYGYQQAYTKLVEATEIAIEVEGDPVEPEVQRKEKTEILKQDKAEKIGMLNLKGKDMISFQNTIRADVRIRYQRIYVKQGDEIEVSIVGDKFSWIRIGIVNEQDRLRYVKDKGVEEISHKFKIKNGGTYDVLIESGNQKENQFAGMISINVAK